MYGLRKQLQEEHDRLERIIKETEQNLVGTPEGRLRISHSRKKTLYYHCTNDNPNMNGVYIPKKQEELARALAQKAYDEKVLKLAKRRTAQLEKMLLDYQDFEIEEVYEEQREERKILITPVEEDWASMFERWNKLPDQALGFNENDPIIKTEKGERVRSKSERILADYFYYHGIPYKYEKPLALGPSKLIYPDFTFLSKATRREIYWEHFGMMEDLNYVKANMNKLADYEAYGIHIGESLIVTFELGNTGVQPYEIEGKLRQYHLYNQ